jgi:plastocyanin
MRFAWAASACLCASFIASVATAGAVHGTLWMSSAAAKSRPSSPEAVARIQRGIADAVIYVESIPIQVDEKLARPGGFLFFRSRSSQRVPRITQNDRKFEPRVLAIPAGSRVAFINVDSVYHNAFSVSPAKRFDLGKYPPGRHDTLRFDRTGVVNLHCDIHSSMLGFIVVTPNHAFTRPDSLGNFRLPKLPPGTYSLHVFHPRRGEVRRQVQVPKNGDLLVDLNL